MTLVCDQKVVVLGLRINQIYQNTYNRWVPTHPFGQDVVFFMQGLANVFVHLRKSCQIVIASTNGNIFRVIGPLWGESTGHRWIHLTKATDAERWWFLWWWAGWANNRDAGDLRRHLAQYDVIVTWNGWVTFVVIPYAIYRFTSGYIFFNVDTKNCRYETHFRHPERI